MLHPQASTPGRQQHAVGRLTSRPPQRIIYTIMPNWHAAIRGATLHLVHSQSDEELDRPGAWDIVLWRGAPSWDSHPELEHAALGVMLPGLHKSYIQHAWVFDIPDRYLGAKNIGDDREWMVLRGGSWTIVLRFPKYTPAAVYAAVAAGFHAQLGTLERTESPQVTAPQYLVVDKGTADFSAVVRTENGVITAAKRTSPRPLTNAARAAL